MEISTKKRRQKSHEDYNREGRWYREFAARSDVWMIVEHWAFDQNYRLNQMKGKKRLYHKGNNPKFLTTYVEIKERESEVVVTAWIQVGWLARLLTLFSWMPELNIEATGWMGIVPRRRACAEINILLDRLKQPAISESLGFHWADLDSSSLLILGQSAFCLLVFLLAGTSRLEIKPGLGNVLLLELLKPSAIILAAVLLLFLLNQLWVLRKHAKVKWVYSTVSILLITGVTFFFLNRTQKELLEAKILFHCINQQDSAACQKQLGKLNDTQKEMINQRLQSLQKELSRSK